tara:strand:+ start:311 stop:1501 length:1191 start_codon:yes stop_codon:yes gene_type:complete
MKNINNSILKQKNILVRVDLNVPFINGVITDYSRIEAIQTTIQKLREKKNKIFLISHFGRPKGKHSKKYSLNFICDALIEKLEIRKIHFLKNFNHNEIQKMIASMKEGDICLFENIRFWSEEESNDLNFAKDISINFDAYVNDAFSASHRKHASIVGFPKFLPSLAGDNMLQEIRNIDSFVNNPKKPNLAIIGGSKISTKIDLLFNLVERCDAIAIGGAMANTFLYASKIDVGKSLCEKDLSKIALSILEKAKKFNCEIILPIDVICADHLTDQINIRSCNIDNIISNQMILDIGEKTTALISNLIMQSHTVLWNGPLGAFEYKPFEQSSIKVAQVIKKNSKLLKIDTIAGGGDTISAIKMAKAEGGFSYISNAGGAFLEWLEGNQSPGVLALKDN